MCNIKLLVGTAILLLITSSCMKDKPDSLPENLEWNPELALPLGDEAFGMNSESNYDTTLLENDSITSLPYWVNQNQVLMERVLDFDVSTIRDNLDKLNRILFRINSSNQFPHTMYSQAYFLDETMNEIDSMFREGPVETPAGTVSDAGVSTAPGEAQNDAIIEGERISPLGNVQSILFRASFLISDLDSSMIPAYPTLQFQINTGLMLDLNFEY